MNFARLLDVKVTLPDLSPVHILDLKISQKAAVGSSLIEAKDHLKSPTHALNELSAWKRDATLLAFGDLPPQSQQKEVMANGMQIR